ncbi:MAG: stalk domain-containing protein [Candidatus Cryosericum sp.]
MKRTGRLIAVVVCAFLFLSTAGIGLIAVRDSSAASYQFSLVNGPYGGSIRSIAVAPSFADDGRVAVGTSNGLFVSRDLGATFSVVRSGLQDHSQSITGVAYSPNYLRDRLILVGTEDGLYRSDDGGASFNYSNKGLAGDAYTTAVVCSPTIKDDGTVFAGKYLSGVWKSVDVGRSWSLAVPQLKDQNVVAIAPSPSFATDHTVLFGVETSADVSGAWISTDGGTSVKALPIVSENTGNAIAFSPVFATDRTFAVGLGSDGLFVTSDGGTSFKNLYKGTVTCVQFSPAYATTHELFVGTAGRGLQVVNTSDASLRSVQMPSYAQSFAITALSASPAFARDGTLFVGTSRMGLFVSRDAGRTLVESSTGITNARVNGVAVSPSFGSDKTVFFGTAYQGVARTFDGGKTVAYCNTGLGDDSVLQVALSPSYATDQTVVAGTDGGGLFVSTDRGDSWKSAGDFGGYAVPWIAFAPEYANSHTAFVSVEGQGIWRTRDGFVTFHQLPQLAAAPDLTDTVVDCIAVSPAFATDGTLFAATHSGRLYMSSDGGDSFSYLAGTGLPRYAVKDLRISPDFVHDKTLYMCTDYGTSSTPAAGIYRSTNAGVAWTQVNSGVWYDAFRISDGYAGDGTVLAVSWGGGLDVTTNRGLAFGSVGSGIPLVSGKYWGNALDISPTFSRDGVVYVGLTNGGVYTTFDFGSGLTPPPPPPTPRAVTITLTIDSPTMTVNGVSQQLDAAPMIQDGRTLVPIRAIVEAIGGSISFDAKDGKGRVDIILNSTTLSLWIGSGTARLNGKNVPIDASNAKVVPIIKSGRTYLPFRFVGESLGCDVSWDGASRVVTLVYRP